MAILRKDPAQKSLVEPSRRISQESLTNLPIPLWNPSKKYQKCSMLVANRNASSGNIGTAGQTYFLMEGNKRFTFTGGEGSPVGLIGYGDSTIKQIEPSLVINNPPLQKDEYFINATQGYYTFIAVTNIGNVYSGAYNNQGQLGHNDTVFRYSLTKITTSAGGVTFGPGGVKAVKAFTTGWSNGTNNTTYIIDSEGKVYGCGFNTNYELGDNTTTQRNAFIRIGTLENISEIYTNANSAYAVRNDGNLYVWGLNGDGQLGLGNTSAAVQPTLSFTGVRKVVASSDGNSAFVLRTNGTVWYSGCAGSRGHNGLGDGNQRNSWTQVTTNISSRNIIDLISCGTGGAAALYRSTWALADDGTIWAWGYNGYGQLGDGTTTDRSTPVQLAIPSGFPKVNKIVAFGGNAEYGFSGINMESGRMFSVGNWCNGCLGVATDASGAATWAVETAIVNRAHYPAREVESIPSVRNGYAKIKDIVTMVNSGSDQARMFALLDDGSVWAKGCSLHSELGVKYSGIWYSAGYSYWNSTRYNPSWKQVRF